MECQYNAFLSRLNHTNCIHFLNLRNDYIREILRKYSTCTSIQITKIIVDLASSQVDQNAHFQD